MKSTRQRLLDFLSSHQAASASELARALQVTPADVRHHLGVLAREGIVVVSSERPTQGRGRPALRYSLATQALKDNFDLLAAALLAESLEGLTPAEQEASLRRVAARLAGGASPGGSLAQRLVRAVQRLNKLDYRARWEARAGAPRLILEHCPFAALLPEHPEVCRLDKYLIEAWLGVPVTQTAQREKSREKVCLYVVGRNLGGGEH